MITLDTGENKILCNALHTHWLTLLFIRAGNFWYVSDQLGEKAGYLRAEVVEENNPLPPVNGWQFPKEDEWSDDNSLQCSREPSAPCKEIEVELFVNCPT